MTTPVLQLLTSERNYETRCKLMSKASAPLAFVFLTVRNLSTLRALLPLSGPRSSWNTRAHRFYITMRQMKLAHTHTHTTTTTPALPKSYRSIDVLAQAACNSVSGPHELTIRSFKNNKFLGTAAEHYCWFEVIRRATPGLGPDSTCPK